MDAHPRPARTPTVALFVTCVVDGVKPDVGVAAVRVLRQMGCAVSCPVGQTCCGQPAWNAGFAAEAAQVARTSMAALEADPSDRVVVPAGSCATMIRRYWPQLFAIAGEPGEAERAIRLAARVVELTELLATLEPPAGTIATADQAQGSGPIAYHRSCHLERELHVVDQPVVLLGAIAGKVPVEWEGDDRCCGFGGTFSVRLPEVSVAMADEKLDSLPDGVTTVVSCDSSCLLHLEGRARARHLPLEFRHVGEVLADALGVGADAPPANRGAGGRDG